MEVTFWTWAVALTGLVITGFLGVAQLIAVLSPRSEWTIKHVYGGSPDATDPVAYFAFNQGFARADVFFWLPLQLGGSVGMLLGERWGFLLAMLASVPFWYSAIPFFIWNRELGISRNTFFYWVVIWGMFPAYGLVAGVYCFLRLL